MLHQVPQSFDRVEIRAEYDGMKGRRCPRMRGSNRWWGNITSIAISSMAVPAAFTTSKHVQHAGVSGLEIERSVDL